MYFSSVANRVKNGRFADGLQGRVYGECFKQARGMYRWMMVTDLVGGAACLHWLLCLLLVKYCCVPLDDGSQFGAWAAGRQKLPVRSWHSWALEGCSSSHRPGGWAAGCQGTWLRKVAGRRSICINEG